MMLLAAKTVKESYPKEVDYGMRIIASPWSPPSWMKEPTEEDAKGASHAENMTGSAEPVCIRDGVGSDSKYAKAWALFFSKFISACECFVLEKFLKGFQVFRCVSIFIDSFLNHTMYPPFGFCFVFRLMKHRFKPWH